MHDTHTTEAPTRTHDKAERYVIAAITALIIMSMAFLFWVERTQNSLTQDKDWWIISFADPEDVSAYTFVIENYTPDHTSFTYTLRDRRFPDTVAFPTETVAVPRGTRVTVPFPVHVSHAELAVAPQDDPKDEKTIWK